jgi:hypothetical protein
MCDNTYSTKGNLTRHFDKIHGKNESDQKYIKNPKVKETNPDQYNEIKPPKAKKAKVVVHDGNKPQFACEICKKSFKSNAYMKKHMLKICSKKNSPYLKHYCQS